MSAEQLAARFNPGRLLITPGAAGAFNPQEVLAALACHLRGDWGDLGPEDKHENDAALEHGGRLLSAYTRLEDEERLWIITEADRSATTALLPDEY